MADVKDPFADVYATSTASELIEQEVLQLPLCKMEAVKNAI